MAATQAAVAATPGVYSVRDYGAVGDGNKLDTAGINRAIEACAAAGGGQVLFPPGRYLSGTVHLKSHVSLFLDAGATLIGSTNLEGYQSFKPPAGTPESKWTRWHRALILGDGVEDVAILGNGVIDGNKVFDPRGEEKMRGPHTIIMGKCRNVTIRDVAVRNSANYAVMLEFCEDVEVHDIRVTGGWDGVHFRGWKDRPCRNLSIIGCRFYTGDDSIAGRYVENLLVRDCVVNSSCNGIRIIGPMKNLVVHDCLFYGPGIYPHRTSKRHNMLSGIILQPGAWDASEGALEDVLISDITMKNVSSPVTVWLKRPGNTAENITVSRLTATGVYRSAASVESWTETAVGNVVFRDMSVEFVGGGKVKSQRKSVGPPHVDARALPAWGFYGRNVKDLSFENVRLSCAKKDQRSAVICDTIGKLTLDGFRLHRPAGAAVPLVFNNVRDVQAQEADVSLVKPRCTGVKLTSEDASGRFVAGGKYTIAATVQNGGEEGLAEVKVTAAGQTTARWVWLRPNEKKEVVFEGLTTPANGPHEVQCGGVKQILQVGLREREERRR
jgi:hypothetical protein